MVQPGPPRWATSIFTLGCCGLLLGACGSRSAQAGATATPVYAPKPAATHVIRLLDSRRFEPAELQGTPGELVKLVLKGDHEKHDFTSPGLNVNIDVPPASVEIIDVELPAKPGLYQFWSAQPGDREGGMVGRFDVRSAAASP